MHEGTCNAPGWRCNARGNVQRTRLEVQRTNERAAHQVGGATHEGMCSAPG